MVQFFSVFALEYIGECKMIMTLFHYPFGGKKKYIFFQEKKNVHKGKKLKVSICALFIYIYIFHPKIFIFRYSA